MHVLEMELNVGAFYRVIGVFVFLLQINRLVA